MAELGQANGLRLTEQKCIADSFFWNNADFKNSFLLLPSLFERIVNNKSLKNDVEKLIQAHPTECEGWTNILGFSPCGLL